MMLFIDHYDIGDEDLISGKEIRDQGMPKVSVSKLEVGMKIAKPVAAKNGMVILGEGAEITANRIERIQDMDITHVFVEGLPVQEEALDNLHTRFSHVEGKPYMDMIQEIVKGHIESLYE
jgi:L-fucose isomerase-like protein